MMSQPFSLLLRRFGGRGEKVASPFPSTEKGEKQSIHLAEGSVNFVKGFFRTLKEDRDWPVSSADTMDN